MTTNNSDLAAQLAALQATVADLKNQCDSVHAKLGWPSWKNEKKQRADNQKAQGTRTPFSPSQHFGEVHRPKDHER